MRILQIHPFMKSESLAPGAGGMPRAALQLTRLLVEAGHDVRVLPIPEGVGSRMLWEVSLARSVEVLPAMDVPARSDLRWLSGAVFRLKPKSRSFREVYYDACALTALRRALISFRPDVVHNHLARRPFPRLMRALNRRERLLLTHHHGEQGEDLHAYDRIVFPSQSALERIVEESGISRDRVSCIHNAVSPVILRSRMNPDARREGFSLALVEALCLGTPVVGWAPQVRELEALLGMAVGEPFDGRTQTVQELAATLHRALTGKTVSAGHRRRLAKAARDFFSEERFLAAYLEIYNELSGA
jgi:glycosyltransferase involved in cell wall biosynthesis